MMMPKATRGTTNISTCFVEDLKLNAEMAPVHLPIIKLPQYIDTNGATWEEWWLPNKGCLNSSPKLLTTVTSTPTYTKMASIPNTSCGYCMAPQPEGDFRARIFEKRRLKTTAASAPKSHFNR